MIYIILAVTIFLTGVLIYLVMNSTRFATFIENLMLYLIVLIIGIGSVGGLAYILDVLLP